MSDYYNSQFRKDAVACQLTAASEPERHRVLCMYLVFILLFASSASHSCLRVARHVKSVSVARERSDSCPCARFWFRLTFLCSTSRMIHVT